MQKYGKFMETRFHELEHESKIRLLKTHSHTSERRGYEADTKRSEGRERKEAYPKGTGKNVNENHHHITCQGERGVNMSVETRKPEVVPHSSRGGMGRN